MTLGIMVEDLSHLTKEQVAKLDASKEIMNAELMNTCMSAIYGILKSVAPQGIAEGFQAEISRITGRNEAVMIEILGRSPKDMGNYSADQAVNAVQELVQCKQ